MMTDRPSPQPQTPAHSDGLELIRFNRILKDVRFNDWEIIVRLDRHRAYLQVRAEEPCSVTGDMHRWSSRKWFLSPHMTESEVVQTAFLAVMTAVEHETREAFTYAGHAIFSPHYDIHKLVALHESGDAHDVRTPMSPPP